MVELICSWRGGMGGEVLGLLGLDERRDINLGAVGGRERGEVEELLGKVVVVKGKREGGGRIGGRGSNGMDVLNPDELEIDLLNPAELERSTNGEEGGLVRMISDNEGTVARDGIESGIMMESPGE